MTTSNKTINNKRKIIEEDLAPEVFSQAIYYINYISTITTFDAIEILPKLNKKKNKRQNKKVRFENENKPDFENEAVGKENEDQSVEKTLVRRVSCRKAAAAALVSIKEINFNILNQVQTKIIKTNSKQKKTESIKFDYCKPVSSFESINDDLKQINDTNSYTKIALEICKILFSSSQLKKGYFYDDLDGPILPDKFNLDPNLTLILKNTIRLRLGLTEAAMNEAWNKLRIELNSILLNNLGESFSKI